MVACSLNCNCSYLGLGLTDCLSSSPLEERILPVSVRALPRHPPWLCEFSPSLAFVGLVFMDLMCWGGAVLGGLKEVMRCGKLCACRLPCSHPKRMLPEYSSCRFTLSSRTLGKPADAWLLSVFTHRLLQPWAPVWLLGVHPAPLNNLQAHQYLLPEYCRISLLLLCPLCWGCIRMTFLG